MCIPSKLYRLMLIILTLSPSGQALAQVTTNPQQYVFERQWPPIPQPWIFDNLEDIALAPDGSLWVLNQSGGFEHLNTDGSIIRQFVQSGTTGMAIAQDGSVWGINRQDGKITHFYSDGSIDKTLTNLPFFIPNYGSGSDWYRSGIAIADDQSFWVTNPSFGLILHFNDQGKILSHGGHTICAELAFLDSFGPYDPEPAKDGSYWRWHYSTVANGYVLRHVDREGNVLSELGPNIVGFMGPTAVAADGSLWIAASNGTFMPPDLRHVSSQGALLTHIKNLVPDEVGRLKIALDGSLWVVHAGKILHLNNQGVFLNEIDLNTASSANIFVGNLAIVSDNSAWVTTYEYESHSKLLHYSNDGSLLKQIDNDGQIQFGFGINIVRMPDNSIWLSDYDNQRLLHLSPQGDHLAQVGLQAIGAIITGWLPLAQDGSLLVNGSNNGKASILHFTAEGQFIESLAGDGYNSCAGSSPGSLAKPQGIALAKDGSIWVADTGNNRIQHFSNAAKFIQALGTLGSNSNNRKA